MDKRLESKPDKMSTKKLVCLRDGGGFKEGDEIVGHSFSYYCVGTPPRIIILVIKGKEVPYELLDNFKIVDEEE